MSTQSIPIGTLIKGDRNPAQEIIRLAPLGFETFSLMFWQHTEGTDLHRTADEVSEAADMMQTPISSLSIYGNTLEESEQGELLRKGLKELLESAARMEVPLVSCFAGRVPGKSVPDSIPAWMELFSPLAERAEALGVRIAFENCRLGDTWKKGKWNIAINPDAWHLMFSALPSPVLGLEWEPCHQVEALADPLPQLKTWRERIIHVHGKDSRIDHELIREKGLYGAHRWHASCFPGFGDTDWREVFTILKESGYTGTVDIEGWNDREYSGEREIEGQSLALTYLKRMRSSPIRS